jgi:hypothetical protein
LLAQIRNDVNAGNWEGVEASMTADAWDAFSAQLTIECLSLLKMDFEFAMPGGGGPDLDEFKDKIRAALDKHKLAEIPVRRPSFRIVRQGEEEESAQDSQDDALADREAQRKQVLERIGDGDAQRQAVADLWAAKSDSPLSLSYLVGTVEGETTDGDTCTLKLKPQNTRADDNDGIAVIIATPPVFVDVVRADGAWKLAGINHEKTDEARKNFRPDLQGSATDF